MLRSCSLILAVAVGLLPRGAVRAVEISLPPETLFLREAPLKGYSLAAGLCVTCHSSDYVAYQPPTLAPTFWKATVVKMQKVYGAPIPDEAVDPIVDYLVKTYGSEHASPGTAPQAPTEARSK